MGKRASRLFPKLIRLRNPVGSRPTLRRGAVVAALGFALSCQSVPLDAQERVDSSASPEPVGGARPPLEFQGERFSIPTRVPDAAIVPIRFKFDPARETPRDCSAKSGGKSFLFTPVGPGVWEALGVVAYTQKTPQVFDLECTVEFIGQVDPAKSKKVESARYTVQVEPRDYPKEALRVDPSKVNPSPKDLKRIQREVKVVGAIYRTLTPQRFWAGAWSKPVLGPQTSRYGNQRTFNGELRSSHQGIDFRAPTGTEILAPAIGKVALVKDLFFSGKTVILDHGFGLFTIYAHLSAFRVSQGEIVKPGRVLGLSGATGRAAGPHLHLGAVLQGVKFNPEDLFEVLK